MDQPNYTARAVEAEQKAQAATSVPNVAAGWHLLSMTYRELAQQYEGMNRDRYQSSPGRK
ncbi:MAG: hypothetical protein WDN25_31030 [Acetobacteraceae bacterium]